MHTAALATDDVILKDDVILTNDVILTDAGPLTTHSLTRTSRLGTSEIYNITDNNLSRVPDQNGVPRAWYI